MAGRKSSLISYNAQSHSSKSLSGYGFEIDSLTDAELIKFVNELKEEIRLLKLENEVLERTIMRLEPALMHGVYQALEYATQRTSSSSLTMGSFIRTTPSKFGLAESLFCSSRLMSSPSRASTRKSSSRVVGNVIYGSGPRINLLEMSELITIEMDIQDANLEKVRKKAKQKHSYLIAQLEEIDLRVSDIEKAIIKFNRDVLINGWDEIAQRIPAETWIRFITDSEKRNDIKISKMRLRTSTLNTQFRKCNEQIKLKSELSASLRPVDFEKLKIENTECMRLIEHKMNQLGELKMLTGDANLNLVIHKKSLMEQNSYLTKLIAQTKNKKEQIVKLDKESDLIQAQADILSDKVDEIRQIRMAYEVPDVMDYVHVKWVLTGLKHDIKTLENRAQIHRIALTTVNKELQTLVSERENEKSKTST